MDYLQIKGGKTVGFKLVELEKGSLLEKIGLRVGDLVVEINQVKLNSPEKALQIFQKRRLFFLSVLGTTAQRCLILLLCYLGSRMRERVLFLIICSH